MPETFTFHLPCELFKIPAVIAPSSSLSPLERLVLRAVHVGVEDFEELVTLFQLGRRPMVDLISDFIRREYIVIDEPAADQSIQGSPVQSRVRLTAAVRHMMDSGRLNELAAGYEQSTSLSLYRELVSGHLLPPIKGIVAAAVGVPVPQAYECVRGAIPTSQREEAMGVLAESARHLVGDGEHKVMGAQLPVSGDGRIVNSQLRYLRVGAKVGRDPNTGDLLFEVVHPSTLPGHIRRAMGRRMASLAREMQTDRFFKNLEAKVSLQTEPNEGLETAVGRFEQMVAALGDHREALAEERQTRLSVAKRDVVELLLAREARRSRILLHTGENNIREQIREMIRTTERQLVIACPTADLQGYEQYRADLRDLINTRPVEVFLLWGSRHGESLDPEFRGGIEKLQEQARLGNITISPVSCRIQARFVASDGHRAIMCSNDFLRGSGRSSSVDLGVVFEAPAGEPNTAVLDLLKWAEDFFYVSQNESRPRIRSDASSLGDLVSTGAEFDWRLGGIPASTLAPVLRDDPVLPDFGSENDTSALARAVPYSVWEENWKIQLGAVQECFRSDDQYVHPLLGAECRSLLWTAIRSAQGHLMVVSENISPEAVDDRLLDALRQRLEKDDLHVSIFYRRAIRGASQPLKRLQEHFPDRVYVSEGLIRANVLVWDGEVALSSISFLAPAVHLEGAQAYRRTWDVGLRLTGPGVAESILHALLEQLLRVPGTVRERALAMAQGVLRIREVAPPVAAQIDDKGLQRMISGLLAAKGDPTLRSRAVRIYFHSLDRASSARWTALRQLHAAALPPDDLELAAAAALSEESAFRHPASTEWIIFLAHRAWFDCRFAHTAAFLAGLDGHAKQEGLPSQLTAELAALAGHQMPFTDRLARFASERADDLVECEMAILLAVGALARFGWPSAGQFLNTFVGRIAGPLAQIVGEHLSYWHRFGAPLPIQELAGWLSTRESRAAAEEYRAEARQAWARCATTGFPFEYGNRIVEALFGSGGVFLPLRDALEKGEPDRAREWLGQHGDNSRAVSRLLDDTAGRVLDEMIGEGELVGGRRMSLLNRMDELVRNSRRWVHEELASGSSAPRLLMTEGVDLCARITPFVAELRAELPDRKSKGHVSTPVLEQWLDLIGPILPAARSTQ